MFGWIHTVTVSAPVRHPGEALRQRALDEQRPPAAELRGASLLVGERPAPHRIVVERDRDRVDHRVEIGRARPANVERHDGTLSRPLDIVRRHGRHRSPVLHRRARSTAAVAGRRRRDGGQRHLAPAAARVRAPRGRGLRNRRARLVLALRRERSRPDGGAPLRAEALRRSRRHSSRASAGCARSARRRSASPGSAWAAGTRTSRR